MRLSSELTVSLGKLSSNYELLKKLTPQNETIFMVKANAYGHGLFEIVFHAFNEMGISNFGVASLGEALELRKKFPEMECELLVFSDVNLDLKEYRESYLEYNIIPVIHCMNDLKTILEDRKFRFLPLVIKFDTGMNRLGISYEELESTIRVLKLHNRKNIFHLMTHFSSSYLKIKKNNKTQRQYQEFQQMKNDLRSAGISIEKTSCSNSGAIEQGVGLSESHIRPGLMLYGPRSVLQDSPWNGINISQLQTYIIKLFSIKKGTPIGYGNHICGHDGYVIYLPIGYADGVLSHYSGLSFKKYEAETKILGKVNMDLTALYFEKVPEGLKSGGTFLLWNFYEDLSEFATNLKVNPYQLFTAITSRVPRRYIK